jgi:hypothetical protein
MPLEPSASTLPTASLAAIRGKRVRPTQPRSACPCAAPTQSPHFALPCVRIRWRRLPLCPTPHSAASAQSNTSGKSAALHALHAQLALPLLATLLAGTPALLRARTRPPPSLRLCARLRSAAPSIGMRHADAEPSHPWHREHGYKRAPLSLARTTPCQPSSSIKSGLLPCFSSPFAPSPLIAHSSLFLASFAGPKELPVEAYLTRPLAQHLIQRSSPVPLSHSRSHW